MSDGADEMIYDGLDIGLERFEEQVKQFEALVQSNSRISTVLLEIHNAEKLESIERVFWAFQFGYQIGIASSARLAADTADSDRDTDANRGYQ